MTESFSELFEQSLASQRIRPGMILTGLVVDVSQDVVVVNVGLKSEAVIPVEQFKNERGEVEVKPGDQVEVALDSVEDGTGETRLSREKAKRARTWTRLETAFNNSEIVTGVITGRVKGGFTVDLGGAEFLQRHAAFGLQTDVDDREILFDPDNLAVDHLALDEITAAQGLVEQGREVFAGRVHVHVISHELFFSFKNARRGRRAARPGRTL